MNSSCRSLFVALCVLAIVGSTASASSNSTAPAASKTTTVAHKDGRMEGRGMRRGGLLVADTRPFMGDAAAMARQRLCKNSCSRHGVCLVQEGGSFPPVCVCFHMWLGDDCSKALCPNNCSYAGRCNTTNGVCLCNEGMGGADCSIDLNAGRCPGDCSGNGICNDGVCSCFQGWLGLDCATTLCPNNCSFHGICMQVDPSFGAGRCACEPGWKGHDCSVLEDAKCPVSPVSGVCSGNGKCDEETGTCVCTRGFSGTDCAQRDCVQGYLSENAVHAPPWSSPGCPNDCSCNGYCVCNSETTNEDGGEADGGACYCACEPSWAGDACSFPVHPEDPFEGVEQPYPDKMKYPEVHPYLSDSEREAIAAANNGTVYGANDDEEQ